jgi:hypothetical protein
MKTLRCSGLLLLAVLLVAAKFHPSGSSAAEFIRQGEAALEREDWPAAVAAFEKAEARTTDPGRVAFHLARARHQLVLTGEGGPGLLRQAESNYRCCLEPNDPHRAKALLGLGQCLVLRGSSQGSLDPVVLREALSVYDRCVNSSQLPPDLVRLARQNRERVRLLLSQAASPTTDQDNNPSGEDRNNPPAPLDRNSETGGEKGSEMGARPTPDPDRRTTPSETGADPTRTDKAPGPGKGNLPPVPDSPNPAHLSPQDAAAHLERAARQVLEERQAYRRSRGQAPPGNGRNW